MKKTKFFGLLLAVFVAMILLPVTEVAGQQVISEEDLVEISPDYATRSIPYVAIFDNGTLTFKYDENKPDGNYNSWSSFVSEIKMVVFDKSCMKYSPTSCANWFRGFNNLVEFNGFSYLNTKNVTDMSQMFYGCSSLTELDLGNFNTANVTNMDGMFDYCSNIQTIFVGDNWTTAKVTNYDAKLFVECKKLVGGKGTACIDDECQWSANMGYLGADVPLPYAHIDGGASNPGYFTKVGEPAYVQRDAYAVFEDGTLTFKYDENKPEGAYENGGWIWAGISADIKVVVFDKSFADYRPTDCAYWFSYCENLIKIQGIENLNTEEVTDMACMFGWCRKIETLDLSNFNTAKVTDMNNMFCLCENLSELNISSFNTENVTSMAAMFYDCYKLTSLDLGNFNTKNVTNMSEMFYGSNGLTGINLSSFNTEKVTNMDRMFLACSGLQKLDLSNFNTKNVTSMAGMFQQTSLQRLDLNNFNTENVTNMAGMFNYCLSLIQLDLGGFNTKKVTNMSQIFRDCLIIKTIFVGDKWTTAAVTESNMMFYGCDNLYGGKGTKCGESDIKYAHIDGGASNPGYLTKSGEEPFLIKIPYVILDEKTKVATLYYGNDAPVDAYTFSSDDGRVEIKRTAYEIDRIRLSNLSNKIKIDQSFSEYKPTSCANWFAYLDPWYYNNVIYDKNHIREIDGLEYINTENVTDMSEMFAGCDFTDLDLSSLNTAKVTNMDRMFEGCEKLETIYIGNKWSTSGVSSSDDMFLGCSNLVGGKGTQYDENHIDYTYAHIDGGESNPGYFTKAGQEPYNVAEPYAVFDNGILTFYYDGKKPKNAFEMKTSTDDEWTSIASEITKVVFDNSFADYRPTSCEYWFLYCSNLTEIEGMKNLNTENVTSIRSMFNMCEKLESIDLSGFDTQYVTNMRCTFYGCNNLKALDLSKFKTENVTTMYSMFKYCENLTNLDLSSFNTKNVTDMSYMLDSCINLKTVDLSSFNTKNVTNMYGMFEYCNNLATIDLSNFDTKNVTNMGFMFDNCKKLQNIDLSNFDTRNVTSMRAMFQHCDNLKNLDLGGFDTKNVEDMAGMFCLCKNLVNINCNGFDTKFVTNMLRMFSECNSLAIINLGSFNTGKVENMEHMFYNCTNLTTIYVGDNWSTSSVTESKDMFSKCTSLVGGKGTEFNSDKTDKSYARIDSGKNNPGYFTKSGEKPYDVSTPVSELSVNSNIKIWSFEKSIYIDNAVANISIVDIYGRHIKTIRAISDHIEIPMTKSGVYIVKTGVATQKVIIH